MGNKKNEVKNEEKDTKVKKKSVSEIRKELRKKARDIDIEVMNISNGSLVYQKGSLNIDLDNIGDTNIVSLESLMSVKGKGLMENLYISIVDIYDEEYNLKDVIDVLGLTKAYKHCDMTIDGIDGFIETTSGEKFEKEIEKAEDKFTSRIIERAVYLAMNDKFDSNYKRSVLEKKANNRFLFNVI